MNKRFQLPEKDFFTIEEVAERWGIKVSDVEHYIYESQTLRLALITKQLTFPKQDSPYGLSRYTSWWSNAPSHDPKSIFGLSTTNEFIELPKYLYIEPLRHIDSFGAWATGFEDLAGNSFIFIPLDENEPQPNFAELRNVICMARTPKDAKAACVITREERDRFERECSSQQEVASSTPNAYHDSTDRFHKDPNLQAKAEEIAKILFEEKKRPPTKPEVASRILDTTGSNLDQATIVRRIRNTWKNGCK